MMVLPERMPTPIGLSKVKSPTATILMYNFTPGSRRETMASGSGAEISLPSSKTSADTSSMDSVRSLRAPARANGIA